MKKVLLTLMCMAAMMAAGTSLKAQEVTIVLMPGWTWISIPSTDTLDFATALGSFTPMAGDIIKSQWGNASYRADGQWRGNISQFYPGYGYMYKSTRTMPVMLTFNAQQPSPQVVVTTSEPTDITTNSATCGGNVTTSNGDNMTVVLRGICWGTNPNPTFNDNYIETGSGLGSFTVSMTELTIGITYYVRAFAVTATGISYGEELSFTTESHAYVNLGLPSGLLWATCNVGADNPEDSGDYFAWGETQPKEYYDWSTYQHSNGGGWENWVLTKYCNNSYYGYNGFMDYLSILQPEDDAATVNWDDGARTPTIEEWQELEEHCTSTWTTLNGVNGRVFTGTNGNTIFLPAVGELSGNDHWWENAGEYWSSTIPTPEYPFTAWYFSFDSEGCSFNWWYMLWGSRDRGRSVRPVRYVQSSTSYSIEVAPNLSIGGSVTGTGIYGKGQTCIVTATANEGYTFKNWTNNGTPISTYSEYAFPVTGDVNIEACFLENSTYPLLYSYNDDNHTATVTGHWDGTNATGDLFIPETVMHNGEAYTVTTIGVYAFSGCSGLTGSLVIPNTVTFIDHDAFNGCTGLTSVIIPNSVTSMGYAAFCWCSGLTSVTMSNLVTSIGDYTFIGCNNLTSVVIPNSVTNIGYEAFFQCSNLTSVEFPISLESISDFAFGECNGITDVIIPSSVTQIGKNPFTKCSNLSQISVESGNIYYDSRDDSHAIIETATNKLVSGSLTSIIPNTVTSMGEEAFWGILVPSITIPESMNYIGADAIRIYTLSSMTVLAEVPPTLDWCAFCDTDHSIPVYVPCGSIEAYQSAEGWSEFTNFIGVGQCSGMVTVTASPAEYGTVSGGGFYEGSATCTVTATPNEGYYFLCWMEDGQWVSSQATYTFPVYRDRNLTAIFYLTLGDEKVVNGDFEQGNVGFTSGYVYNIGFGCGGYYVDDNPNIYWNDFQGYGHGETGYFMFLDGATEPGINVWTEQIPVEPNTYYVFSTWVCTLIPESMAMLQFSINGTQVGDVFTAPSQTNTWEQFNALWYSGNSTTATITIVNQNTAGNGNDFGLDDISFREMNPVQGGIPTGAINGKFTINEDGDQVYFSQGNLQYQASTNTWRFAENQYDYVGSTNSNISYTYSGWIDLFGWGTSGWNSGNTYYHPWDSNNPGGSLYGPSGSYNLTGDYANADWGVYNPISNSGNIANQ